MKKRSQVDSTQKMKDASQKLADEVKKTNKEEDKKNGEAKMAEFLGHSRFPTHPKLPDAVERIVETVFKVDFASTYQRLIDGLTIEGALLGDRGTISSHLNHAEDNSRLAHTIYVQSKMLAKEFEDNNDIIRSAMWAEATSILQAQKERGERNKQITDGDVKMKCAELHPDEWKYVERRSTEVKLFVEHLQHLVGDWGSRCASLRALLDSRR